MVCLMRTGQQVMFLLCRCLDGSLSELSLQQHINEHTAIITYVIDYTFVQTRKNSIKIGLPTVTDVEFMAFFFSSQQRLSISVVGSTG